jgi:hypothetical protein
LRHDRNVLKSAPPDPRAVLSIATCSIVLGADIDFTNSSVSSSLFLYRRAPVVGSGLATWHQTPAFQALSLGMHSLNKQIKSPEVAVVTSWYISDEIGTPEKWCCGGVCEVQVVPLRWRQVSSKTRKKMSSGPHVESRTHGL